jgi:hypothetical protein
MKKNDVVKCLPLHIDQLSNYQACQFSKQNRKPLPKLTWKSTQKLQLIYINVGGLQKTSSLKGSCYYIFLLMTLLECVGFCSWNTSKKMVGIF